MFTINDYWRSRETWERNPGALVEKDFQILAEFGNESAALGRDVDRARAAHMAAISTSARRKTASARDPVSTAETPPTPRAPFDQEAYHRAAERFTNEPAALTDEDLVQLSYVGIRRRASDRRDTARGVTPPPRKQKPFVTAGRLHAMVLDIMAVVGKNVTTLVDEDRKRMNELDVQLKLRDERIAALEQQLSTFDDRLFECEARAAVNEPV